MTVIQEGLPQPEQPTHNKSPVITAFGHWAVSLCDRSGGDFVPLDLDDPAELAEATDYMDLSKAFYPASEMGDTKEGHENLVGLLHELGNQVLLPGDFKRLVDAFATNNEVMSFIKGLSAEKENLLISTNHDWLANTAIKGAAVYCAVDTPGFAHDSGTVLNKALGFMEAVVSKDEDGMPIAKMPALRPVKQFTNVYTCVPQSDSLDKPELSVLKSFGNDYNPLMIRPLVRQAHAGGKILTAALSGSLDKKYEATQTVRMKPADEVSAKIFSRYFHYSLPVTAVLKENGRLEFEIGQIKSIANSDDIHDLMHTITEPYARLLGPGWQVYYDDPR